jgi:hypothetical protein
MLKLSIKFSLKEIALLTIIFTSLALYMNIHEEKIVFNFIADHIVALFISLILSKILSNIIYKNYKL